MEDNISNTRLTSFSVGLRVGKGIIRILSSSLLNGGDFPCKNNLLFPPGARINILLQLANSPFQDSSSVLIS